MQEDKLPVLNHPSFWRMLWSLEVYVCGLLMTFQFGEVWRIIKALWAGSRS
jgi:hypothetical protein